ncbi:hypothetical protein K491DRAFT_716166 [Lophiostoma macrostomum CBS 122681]|uniref:Uncharacterized protein n=1 Tax=Lophiostoma macrostomum CBS 122681 TaxID=1314788 RepID=A0A6A6T6F3_9PLEO|nr:hypothetical protein K491DRAFT_716166 [Lophiostoma macrostomum CBS 122681]
MPYKIFSLDVPGQIEITLHRDFADQLLGVDKTCLSVHVSLKSEEWKILQHAKKVPSMWRKYDNIPPDIQDIYPARHHTEKGAITNKRSSRIGRAWKSVKEWRGRHEKHRQRSENELFSGLSSVSEVENRTEAQIEENVKEERWEDPVFDYNTSASWSFEPREADDEDNIAVAWTVLASDVSTKYRKCIFSSHFT